MINRKSTFVTVDGKYQMVYTPQRVYGNKTHLAKFELQKWCDRGDLGKDFITIHGYATNYKPSAAFPLPEKIESVMQMLVTDFNAAEWFAKLPKTLSITTTCAGCSRSKTFQGRARFTNMAKWDKEHYAHLPTLTTA